MKKKIFGAIAVLAIVAMAAFNLNVNLNQGNNISSLMLANVEALAQGEYKGDKLYKTECEHTKYIYGQGGRLEETITYKAPCCVDGEVKCYL